MTTSMLTHLVIVPDDSRERRTTFFQGFSDFWHPDYLTILKVLTCFPHDMGDIYFSGQAYVISKAVSSSLQIHFLRADLTEQYLTIEKSPQTIVWSTELTVDAAQEAIGDKALIHISTAYRKGVLCITDLNEVIVRNLISELLSKLAETNEEFAEFKKFVEHLHEEETRDKLVLQAKGHNCTVPMLDTLVNYGALIEITPIKPSGNIDQHVTGMVELGAVIDGLRPAELGGLPYRKNDVIIHCPSVYTFLYRADSAIWRRLNRQLNNPKRNFLRAALIRGKGYGNATIQIEEENIFNPYEDPILRPLLCDRQIELQIYTAAISLVAANQFIPAFRLPNDVMLHHDKLSEIGAILSSNDRHWREKLNVKMLEYSRLIKEEIGEPLFSAALKEREKLLAVCDFPIEWVAIDQLPLMFKYELSRVPSTPGNVTLDVLTTRPKSEFNYRDLRNVLIIRSFDDCDTIKNHLSDALEKRQQAHRLPGMDIRLVDVKTRQDILDALNEFNGMMVIFDCHGGHGGETDSAWLNIGEDKLSVWHIYREARVPPIVLLAACSTHPAEGSHASVANGFLESGVFSVIGTFAPVDSLHAAVFVTRLLERIAIYLPLVLKRRSYTWREITTGLLRMSYVRDVLETFRDKLMMLNQAQYEEIHINANMLINTFEDEKWFDKFRLLISEAIGFDKESEQRIWNEQFHFVESMLFVQLGRPENIVIVFDDPE